MAEKFRAVFVEAFENSGGVENAAATKVAETVADEALTGELPFVQADADGFFYIHQTGKFVDGTVYAVVVTRVDKDFGTLAANFLDAEGQGMGVAGPFGVAAEYNEDYYYISAAVKAL